MRTFILCFVLLLVTVLGCTKAGKNISITGIVRNPLTGQPYADVQIKLLRTDGGLPGGLKDVETVYTNTDGYFEIHHYGAYKHYELGAYPDTETKYIIGWFEDGVHVGNGRMNVEKGHYMNPVFEMVPYGKYSLDVNNINCQGPSDTIIINQQNQVMSFLDLDWTLVGCSGYTTATESVPMGSITIKWTVIRNGISNYFTDEIFIDEGGEVNYTLDY